MHVHLWEAVVHRQNQTSKRARLVHSQLSQHARKRAQQRGISEACVPLILGYGEAEHDGQGGVRYLMTQRALDKLMRVTGSTSALEALRGVYVVLSADGTTVLTVSHRH